MSGAEAEVYVNTDDVELRVEVRSGQIGSAAAYVLFEETTTGAVEVSRLGSDNPSVHLAVPRPGSYFAEVTDARGKRYRTQTLPVEPAFFDLAAQRGRESREWKAKREAQKKRSERETAARAAAVAAQVPQAAKAGRSRLLAAVYIVGTIVVAIWLVVLFRYLTR